MPPAPRPTRLRPMPALDGLRGLAVVGVVVFHLGHLTGGYLGVDLFFTLSGFLITSLLVAEWRAGGRIDLKAFWVRRLRRLLPALLLVLAAVALATRWWASSATFGRVRGDGLAALLYVANWREVLASTDYWNLTARPSPLQHMWSLAIEEQFYLLWPLLTFGVLALAVRRGGRTGGDADARTATPGDPDRPLRALLGVTVVLALASAGAGIVLHGGADDVNRVYYGTDTRAFAILAGAALALVLALRGPITAHRTRRAVDALAAVALVGLGWAWFRLSGTSDALYSGLLPLCGLAAVALIAAASAPEPGVVARALTLAPLRWLGTVSYGLYLWHWPIITTLTSNRTGLVGFRLTALVLAVTLVLTIASYHLVEQPIRHGRLEGRPARVAAPVAMAAVAGLVVWSTMGAITIAGPEAAVSGRDQLREADTPVEPLPDGWSRVLLVGDSGAWAVGPTLIESGARRRIDVINRGTPACGVLRATAQSRYPDGREVADPPGCGDWPDRWAGHVDVVGPDLALLFQVAPGGPRRFVDGRWRDDCDPAYARYYRDEIRRAVEVLGADGARVAVTTVLYPETTSDPEGVQEATDCRNRSIRRAAEEQGALVLDLFDWACEEGGTCSETVETLDGEQVPLRPDGLHFTNAGSRVMERWLLDELDPILPPGPESGG